MYLENAIVGGWQILRFIKSYRYPRLKPYYTILPSRFPGLKPWDMIVAVPLGLRNEGRCGIVMLG